MEAPSWARIYRSTSTSPATTCGSRSTCRSRRGADALRASGVGLHRVGLWGANTLSCKWYAATGRGHASRDQVVMSEHEGVNEGEEGLAGVFDSTLTDQL